METWYEVTLFDTQYVKKQLRRIISFGRSLIRKYPTPRQGNEHITYNYLLGKMFHNLGYTLLKLLLQCKSIIIALDDPYVESIINGPFIDVEFVVRSLAENFLLEPTTDMLNFFKIDLDTQIELFFNLNNNHKYYEKIIL